VCVLPKTLEQPRKVKIGSIMPKFDSLVDWMKISQLVFHF